MDKQAIERAKEHFGKMLEEQRERVEGEGSPTQFLA